MGVRTVSILLERLLHSLEFGLFCFQLSESILAELESLDIGNILLKRVHWLIHLLPDVPQTVIDVLGVHVRQFFQIDSQVGLLILHFLLQGVTHLGALNLDQTFLDLSLNVLAHIRLPSVQLVEVGLDLIQIIWVMLSLEVIKVECKCEFVDFSALLKILSLLLELSKVVI